MSSTTEDVGKVPMLNDHNYLAWSMKMAAHLCMLGAYCIVQGKELEPTQADIKDAAALYTAVQAWQTRREKAAGAILLRCEPKQLVHLKGEEDDPKVMWEHLEAAHRQKVPGMHFNAYNLLFSIAHEKQETLQSLCARVEKSMQELQLLHPKDIELRTAGTLHWSPMDECTIYFSG